MGKRDRVGSTFSDSFEGTKPMSEANGTATTGGKRGRKAGGEVKSLEQLREELRQDVGVDLQPINLDNPDQRLTLEQAAKYVGVSKATMTKYSKPQGDGSNSEIEFQDYETPFFKSKIVTVSALNEFLRNRQSNASTSGGSATGTRKPRELKVRVFNQPINDEMANTIQQLIDGTPALAALGLQIMSRDAYNQQVKARKEEAKANEETSEEPAPVAE